MLRTSLLALAATVGVAGFSEFAGNQADASTYIRIGIGVPVPVVRRPIYEPVVVTPVVPVTPVIVTPAPCCYEVFYRDCPRDPWRVYGCYGSRYQARDMAFVLRGRGLEAYVGPR
jgi:hypothetical protein